MPIVRDRVTYTQLLHDIRTRQVEAVHRLQLEQKQLSDTLLLEYNDGSLKYAHVPSNEPRVNYAIEAHGIR